MICGQLPQRERSDQTRSCCAPDRPAGAGAVSLLTNLVFGPINSLIIVSNRADKSTRN
jgi:hypothetical protein